MLANRGQEIFVEASLRQKKLEETVLKGSRLLAVLPTLGRPWTAKVSGKRGFGRSREGADLGKHVLESLVAHRLIDRGIEWHLHRHRYEHSAREIYLAKTMRWHPKTSCIVVLTYSWIVKLPFSTISKAGGRIYPAYSASSCNVRRA